MGPSSGIMKMGGALATIMLTATSTQAISQFGPEWIKIGGCNEFSHPGALRVMTGGISSIRQLAQSATQVKICEWNSTTDCVTSRPGSYPILNLRSGILLLSHPNLGQEVCNSTCVTDTWTGPHTRMQMVRTGCGSVDHDSQSDITRQWWFWACGNGNGLHVSQNAGPCDWAPGMPGSNAIEFFINAGSFAPTPAPTSAPTSWFESEGHNTTFTEIQTRLTTAEMELVSVRAQLTDATTQRDLLADTVQDLTSMVNDLNYAVLGLATNATMLKQALVSAATTDGTRNNNVSNMPQISAEGRDLILESPGSISIQGRTCNADLCDITSFGQRLQDALRQLDF